MVKDRGCRPAWQHAFLRPSPPPRPTQQPLLFFRLFLLRAAERPTRFHQKEAGFRFSTAQLKERMLIIEFASF